VRHAVGLHLDLVQVPLPLTAGAHSIHPSTPDLVGEHRVKPVPPVPHGLVADFDATLVQKVPDVAER
jgi:hypothetical protein